MKPVVVSAALVTVMGCVLPAFAQDAPAAGARTYRGLFAGASEGTSRARSALSMTFLEAYDDDLAAERIGPPQSVVSDGGFFNAFMADATYHSTGRRTQYTVNGGTNLRFYPQTTKIVGLGHYAGAGLSTPLWRGATFSASQGMAYAPSYWYRLFPAAAMPEPGEVVVASDYAINAEASFNYDTTVALEMPAGRHNAVSVRGGGRYTDYVTNTPIHNFWDYEVGGTFSRGLSVNTRLSAGYLERRTRIYAGTAPERDVTVGFDFGRRLSATRVATFSVSGGMAMLDEPAVDGSVEPQRGYRWIADAGYARHFGRTWLARGAYHRGFGVIEGIATPLFSDGFTGTAEGFVTRAVDLRLVGSYSHGDQSMRPTATSWFTTYTGSARARVGLNAAWAIYLEYVYYYYDFRDISVPPGVPPTATRNALRVGVTTWIPLARSR